ncbi:MAG: phosphoribosylamine--glycine ligase [Kiritimatiellae bacterium]|nr:phosphoribosylamine--glycine ligase [Kiritimatiellia bacterium]
MKILIVGSGGREHAITWRLAQDECKHELYCAPGNAGTSAIATNISAGAEDIDAIVSWAKENKPDLVAVGPEAPLCKGLADALSEIGIKTFGPCKAGARMEGSKAFAKDVMISAGVPTAKAKTFTDAAEAKAALPEWGLPVVIKADGLAAGKGVIIAETKEQAEAAIDDMLVDNKFGAAGAEVLIEEFLEGEECSILALVDGEHAVLLPSSQDHKRIFDGDKGPNTGGMGAYSPAPVVTADRLPTIRDSIIMPVVRELAKRGIVYKGVLYAGLMINNAGGKKALNGSDINVLEFNARFGDPETEAVLPRLGGDFAKVLTACADGTLKDSDVVVKDEAAATIIIASGGYPGDYEKGKEISGLDEAQKVPNAVVFHCGTKEVDGKVVTSGGRVLSVTALGKDLREAVNSAYEAVNKISFENSFHRNDIAHRAFNRG